ncbi:hypothetical protein SLEP1_g31452 [Rubroshorea leprosula]|uniref:Leucine-rich repeat-containing N-terminal plant-type domain-containing protein n=1 Tax=Rubroshorea leprosula TaxID=152421 RepID=A0AAV5KAT5_9ROSI|nr:hypothetical protein SLEP1_g31452 [Rubroshorea leprosula]
MRFLQKLNPLVFLLFFFISFSTTLSSSYSATQLCSHEQAAALLQFKSSFSINKSASFKWSCEQPYDTPYPKTESWKEGIDCCSWDGVTCHNVTGHVIGVDLSNSCLHGSFPSNNSLFLIKSLQTLNLACNDFKHSKIPREIGQFASLKHLDLSNSVFSGQVPEEISHLSKLVSLDLSRVEFPFDSLQEEESSLKFQLKFDPIAFKGLVKNLSEVRKLSLGRVNMSSVDPRYILNLSSSLTDLILFECDMGGNFPNNIFQFPNLKVLVLCESRRQLAISLPRFNLSSPLKKLTLLNMLCLGKLSDSIGDLKSLKFLFLSCNLQGSIPASIGNLSQLNLLVGEIPQKLVSLTSLSDLNLSNNQLVGLIPLGNQFNTFENSSYEGNLGLCGFPLTKTCDANGTRQKPQGSFHEKDELWGFGWRVVLLGYGCGVVFGLLMGYLVFQTGKPKWFVSLVGVQRNQRTRKIRKARVRALGNI